MAELRLNEKIHEEVEISWNLNKKHAENDHKHRNEAPF